MKKLIFVLAVFSLFGCSKKLTPVAIPEERIDRFYNLLAGTYTNETQVSETRDTVAYTMHIAPIWKHLKDEHWLYVERYQTNEPNIPKNQKIIKLVESLDFLKQQIYALPNQKKYEGAWKHTAVFDSLSPEKLYKMKGCTLFFKEEQENMFKGITLGKSCVNRFKGAHYARTDMTVQQDEIRFLEQGFDDKGVFIWGPKNGGYLLEQIEDKKN